MNIKSVIYVFVFLFVILVIPSKVAAQSCSDLGLQDCGASDVCTGVETCCRQCPDNSTSPPRAGLNCVSTGSCSGSGEQCNEQPANYCNNTCPANSCCFGTCVSANCVTNFSGCSSFSSIAQTVCQGTNFQTSCGNGFQLTCPGTKDCGPSCTRTSCSANPACGTTASGVDNCGQPCTLTGPACAPGCFGGCGSYLQQGNCPAGQQQSCSFVSTAPGCTDGGAWNPFPGCQGSCGGCFDSGSGPGPQPPPPPPACNTVEIGAGCGSNTNSCCDSARGLRCSNPAGGTCVGNNNCPPTNPSCNPACYHLTEPYMFRPGYYPPPPGVPSDEPVVAPSLPNFSQRGGNNGPTRFGDVEFDLNSPGTCTAAGRIVRLTIGLCEDGTTVWDPNRCTPSYYSTTTPSTVNWSGGTFGIDNSNYWLGRFGSGVDNIYMVIPQRQIGNFQCIPNGDGGNYCPDTACFGGVATPGFLGLNSCDMSRLPQVNGQGTHTYWYQLNTSCDCNTFNQDSQKYVFIYNFTNPVVVDPRPGTPTLVCQAATDGNTGRPDICDQARQGSPLGYGNASRFELSAKDGGPAGPRQPLYSHNYNIRDTTTGQFFNRTGRNNGPGANFGLNALNFLANGHRYQWNVTTHDNALPTNPTPDSGPSLTWEFLYDTSNPVPGLTGINNGVCYDPATLPPNFTVSATDPVPSGGEASVVKQVSLNINGTNSDISASCAPSGNNPLVPISWNCPRSTSFVANPPSATGDIYTLSVGATDKAGNGGVSGTTRFIYKSQCIGPWLQTLNGDVHSNDKVNTPGGPQ